MGRKLIIDESLDKRLAGELKKRGRDAESHATLGFTSMLDPEALRFLGTLADDDTWVLVTADDRMPWEHGPLLAEIRAAIATIDGEWERICAARGLALTHEQYKRDTVHRWLHLIEQQEPGIVKRYSPVGQGPWRVRRKYRARNLPG